MAKDNPMAEISVLKKAQKEGILKTNMLIYNGLVWVLTFYPDLGCPPWVSCYGVSYG